MYNEIISCEEFKIIAVHPSMEHKGAIAVLISYANGKEEVRLIKSL